MPLVTGIRQKNRGKRQRPAITLVAAMGLLQLATAPGLNAQAPDTTGQRPDRQPLDSLPVALPAVEVIGSISPTAGPAVGSAVPARMSVVGRQEAVAWRPRTLADALSMQPGISLHDDLGSQYKLNVTSRGFTVGPTVGMPSGLSVFLDGVRQNEPGAQEVNFDLLPLEHVKRIELLSGTASLLGPNSLAGAVNLITLQGADPTLGQVELAAGSFGAASGKGSLSGTLPNALRFYAGAGYEQERGWRDATSATNHNALLNVGRDRGDRGLRLQAHAARSRAETAGSLPESIYDVAPRVNFTPGDFEDLDVQQLALTGHAPLRSGRASFRTYARRSAAERFNVNQPPDEDVRGLMLNRSVGVAGDWLWDRTAADGTVAVRTGVDGAAHNVRGRIFLEPGAGGGADSLTTDIRSPGWDVAGFVIGDYRSGRVTLSGGARYDYVRVPYRNLLDPSDDTTSTFQRLNPRLGLSIDIGAGALLYASAGQSFRAPAILELGCADPEAACPLPFALGDDPPLAPVRATTVEGGMRWARRSMVLSASAYRTAVRDEIFFVAAESARLGGYFTNIPHTRRVGAEFAAQSRVGERVQAYGSYAWTLATFESAAEIFSMRSDDDFTDSPLAGRNDVTPGDRIPMIPAHQARGGMLLSVRRALELGVDARYTGRQWFRGDEANEMQRLEPFLLVNGRLAFGLDAWELAAIVHNVFDSRKATFGTFNENRQTGELERFLTPVNARTFRVALVRRFTAAQ
jgi:iron complex outermembrane recepter protein